MLIAGYASDSPSMQLHQSGLQRDSKWFSSLEQARVYFREHGHLLVPQRYVTSSGFRLGRWVSNLRSDFRAERLPAERKSALLEVGMVWQAVSRDAQWQQGLLEARAYHRDHGHLEVPATFVAASGFPLGRWAFGRRQDRRHGIAAFTEERQTALEQLGISWRVLGRRDPWERGLHEAKLYREQHGHLRVPQSHITKSGFKLGNWISARRKDYRGGCLLAARRDRLNNLGMVWEPRQAPAPRTGSNWPQPCVSHLSRQAQKARQRSLFPDEELDTLPATRQRAASADKADPDPSASAPLIKEVDLTVFRSASQRALSNLEILMSRGAVLLSASPTGVRLGLYGRAARINQSGHVAWK
jgi:hypothetical protein